MWKADTKLRRLAAIAVSVALLLSGWLYWNREPRYRGVPASSYVLELIGPKSLPSKSPHDGIREMGPEIAVPALIRVIEAQDSSLTRWYSLFHSKLPSNMRKPFPAPRDQDRIIGTAFIALAQFGFEASPAVPALTALYKRRPRQTIPVLSAIGSSASNAVPTLIHGLHPANPHCFEIASALWRIDPSGDLTAAALSRLPAGGELRAALRNLAAQKPGDAGLPTWSTSRWSTSRWGACEVLGCFRPDADVAVPALATFLQADSERIRAKAAQALGRFGTAARGSAQDLRPLLLDDWRMVREAATNALKAIEPPRP